MSDEAFDASLDLLRRLNPKEIKTNLTNICRLAPDLAEDLLSSVDTPLEIKRCTKSGKNYLTCDYNRDGDSYRSPWSNEYYPTAVDEDGPFPSEGLRALEVVANDSFDIYRDLYYEGGISSVYLWNTEDDESLGFAGVVLLKKSTDSSKENSGAWDSIHVFEVDASDKKQATYKITSTIILDLALNLGFPIELSGNLTRQTEKQLQFTDDASHIANVGSLVEDIEYKLRNMLQEVYFGKTQDIIGDLRTTETSSSIAEEKLRHGDIIKGIQGSA